MKIGFIRPKTDLTIKHIVFIVNGEEHFITFRFSHLKGISDVRFDGCEVEITDAYPPSVKLVKECASVILHDMHVIINKIVHKKKNHIQ